MTIHPIDGFVTANGLRLHYRRWGAAEPVNSLPPFLLLHGLASSAYIWSLVAPLLAGQGHTVVALDQRGHGESDKPAEGYDFATILADDRAATELLDIERPIIVGHSWGAGVALDYAAAYPEQTAALVLVDGAVSQFSLRPGWSREQAIKDLAPPRFAGTPRESFISRVRSGPLGSLWSPELEDIMLHIVQLRDDDTIAPRLEFENHLQIIGAMWDQPTFELYKRVRCPITLIVAEMEPTDERGKQFRQLRNEGIARIQQIRPDIRVVRMPDTIHDIPLQRPEELAAAILNRQ